MDSSPSPPEPVSTETTLERRPKSARYFLGHPCMSLWIVRLFRALVSFLHICKVIGWLRFGSLNIVAIVDWTNPIPDMFYSTCTSSTNIPLLSRIDVSDQRSRYRCLPYIWLPTRHLASLVQTRLSSHNILWPLPL